MPETRLRELLPNMRELALLFGARGLACVAVWRSGFRALSDDDYARISIAQRFAHEAHFDPTGTSWLPVPFWAYGAAFRVFGTSLDVARAVAVALTLAATVLVYVAARVLGTSRFSAMTAAVLSCTLVPYSMLLGVAALPELPCAALLLFSAATLETRDVRLRALGSSALILACLSRYEAWPIAAVCAVFGVLDAIRERNAIYLICTALALSGPVLWLALGHVNHGDAWFFIGRVTAYRRALGGNDVPLWQRLIEYPWAVIWDGQGLCALLAFVIFMARRWHQRLEGPIPTRCIAAMLGMLTFLMLGSVRDGVPTHHAARVLLPIWFLGCVITGRELTPREISTASRRRIIAGLVAITLLPLFVSVQLARDESFAQRALELEAGNAARMETKLGLAIDTVDYGYFAVQAGFGTPIGTIVLDDHDPRHRAPTSANPFASSDALEQALREQHARYAVLTSTHAPLLAPRCDEIWRNSGFVLFRCPTIESLAS